LPLQQKIADVLNLVDNLIEKRKEQIKRFDLLVKTLFIGLFGDPITNPMGWEVFPLGELGELNRGISKHRPRNALELLGGDYPLIQTGEIAAADLYLTDYKATYSEIGLSQSKMWSKGTLCITIAANIAKTAILKIDACFPDSIVGFISGERTNQIFIHFWFSFFQTILEEQAPESAQKNINLQILCELNVITPPLPLQTRFADLVQQVDKIKFVVQDNLDVHYYIHYYVHKDCIVFSLENKVFIWSEQKNQENIKKHGLSFQEAVLVFLDPYFIIRYDEAHSTLEESRWKGIGVIGNDLLLSVIFVEVKGNEIRLISAREASKKEKENYSENIGQIFGY
jgi:uncharacterized DUF497 family protein